MDKSPGPKFEVQDQIWGKSYPYELVVLRWDLLVGTFVIAFVEVGIRVSHANLRTARLHSRRNPEAWYTRLTARPKANTP